MSKRMGRCLGLLAVVTGLAVVLIDRSAVLPAGHRSAVVEDELVGPDHRQAGPIVRREKIGPPPEDFDASVRRLGAGLGDGLGEAPIGGDRVVAVILVEQLYSVRPRTRPVVHEIHQ